MYGDAVMNRDMLIGILLGYVTCMIADVFFSIANFFVQRALKDRAIRKAVEKEDQDNVH